MHTCSCSIFLAALALVLSLSSCAVHRTLDQEEMWQRMADGAPAAPLFVDPVFDGSADPTWVWNRELKQWWIFYTQRRANTDEPGVRWLHGTEIGIAASPDNGRTWKYRGTARGLSFEPGQRTWWAPEVLWAEGRYHMFVSYIPVMTETWSGEAHILHYTSADLIHWTFIGRVPLSSNRVIDPGLYHLPDGTWAMWYKDEADRSHIYLATSADLNNWKVVGPAEASRRQEAPNVFRLGGKYWMLTDAHGLYAYSSDDGRAWKWQGAFMRQPGIRPDDNWVAQHPDVVVLPDAAYIIYFVHPFGNRQSEPGKHRSVLQAAKLEVKDGKLIAVRDHNFLFYLSEPAGGLYHGE